MTPSIRHGHKKSKIINVNLIKRDILENWRYKYVAINCKYTYSLPIRVDDNFTLLFKNGCYRFVVV